MSKLYPCKKCRTEVPIRSKGLCPKCREEERRENGEVTAYMKQSPIPKITQKTKEKNKERKNIRDIYFDYHIGICKVSEESNAPIHNPNRSNICHILPKSTHKSLQGNLDNYVYLTFDEHTRFDKLLFEHRFDELENEFPNSWGIVLKRLEKLLPLCLERTKLYFELNKYLKL